jgi:hypothetical protein
MIDKKTEIFTPELDLFSIQGKNIELNFSGDRISCTLSPTGRLAQSLQATSFVCFYTHCKNKY